MSINQPASSLALILVGALLALPARAQIGEVLKSGLCEETDSTRYSQPQSTAGYATVGRLRITSETGTIPLRKNISFGFTWRAAGLPPVREIEVEFIIAHPQITRPDGKRLTGFEEHMKVRVTDGAVQSTDCYALSENHELVAGEWSIAVAYRGKVLVSQRYQVVKE